MAFLTNISRKQKRDILYKYLVLGQDLAQIHNEYRDKVTLGYFRTVVSKLMAQDEYMEYAMEMLMGVEAYEGYKGRSRVLGSKDESYWRDEDEMIFHNATYKTLSHDERLIYSSAYLENFLETRNQTV